MALQGGDVGGGGGSSAFPIINFTETVKILALTDNKKFIVMDNVGAQFILIPDDAAVSFPIGAEIGFSRKGAGSVSFLLPGSDIFDARDGLFGIGSQFSAATLKKIDTNEWQLIGDLTAIVEITAFNLSDLVLWYDAADLTTILEDDNEGFVSAINDKSGNGNNLLQTASDAQPTTGAVTINGLNVLGFDGADDFMQLVSFVGGLITQPNTVIIVWELPVLPSSIGKIIDGGGGSTRHIVEMKTGNEWSMFAGAVLTGSVRAANTPYLTVSTFNTINSEGYINGVLDISGNVGSVALNGITVGSRFSIDSFLNIKIGEIIIYKKELLAIERQVLQNLLFNKWGIV